MNLRAYVLHEKFSEFLRFCLVGLTGVGVDMLILYLLSHPRWLGLNLTLSKIISAETALLNNFFWNEVWTFRTGASSRKSKYLASRLWKFHAICVIGIGGAVLLLHFFHDFIGIDVFISNFLAIGLVTLWNYWLNARFNWSAGTRKK